MPDASNEDPELGDTVVYSGRTSGIKTATVDKVNVVANMANGMRFTDQFRLNKPAIGGDSGAPVYTQTGNGLLPGGMVFAGNENHAYCNYASNIEAESGLTILPSGGAVGGQTANLGLVLTVGLGAAAAYAYANSR